MENGSTKYLSQFKSYPRCENKHDTKRNTQLVINVQYQYIFIQLRKIFSILIYLGFAMASISFSVHYFF